MGFATTTPMGMVFVMNWKSQVVPTQRLPTTHHLPQTTTELVSSRLAGVPFHLPATSIQRQTSTCLGLVTSLACMACLQPTAVVWMSWLATLERMSHAFTWMVMETFAPQLDVPTRRHATSIQRPKSTLAVNTVHVRCLVAPTSTRAISTQMPTWRMVPVTTRHVWAAWMAML